MKFKTIEGQPKFHITLTPEEAAWLHSILDGFESPDVDDVAEEPKLVGFIETLRQDIDDALYDANCNIRSFEECFGDAPKYALKGEDPESGDEDVEEEDDYEDWS